MSNNTDKKYQCPECGLCYEEKEWADKCEAWCRRYRTCNIEITSHAVDNKNKLKTKTSMNNDPDKKTYTCPMHPDVVQDTPGRCPECGMNLIVATNPDTSGGEHPRKSSGGCCGM